MDNRPIGIFDSGMGGLTVRAAIEHALPRESLVYFGDGANVPYGPRQKEEITAFVDEAVERLVSHNDVKMIVIACNAATGAAIDHLRTKYGERGIPIIGMEPAVKPAVLTTKTGVIGILATAAAFKGALYRATSARYRDAVHIFETVGDGFVELVENDRENTTEALETVRRAVMPMLAAGADRIVLGCTHYPFLVEQIGRVIDECNSSQSGSIENRIEYGGEHDVPTIEETGRCDGDEFTTEDGRSQNPRPASIQIVDSAPAIARRVGQLLTENDLHADGQNTPRHEFLSFAGDDYREHLMRKSAKVPLF